MVPLSAIIGPVELVQTNCLWTTLTFFVRSGFIWAGPRGWLNNSGTDGGLPMIRASTMAGYALYAYVNYQTVVTSGNDYWRIDGVTLRCLAI